VTSAGGTPRHFPGAMFGGVKNSRVGYEEDIAEIGSYTRLNAVNVRSGQGERGPG
jgi:hypothetical protein